MSTEITLGLDDAPKWRRFIAHPENKHGFGGSDKAKAMLWVDVSITDRTVVMAKIGPPFDEYMQTTPAIKNWKEISKRKMAKLNKTFPDSWVKEKLIQEIEYIPLKP